MASSHYFHTQLLTILSILFLHQSSSLTVYNILNYGAKPDGKTDATKPFLDTWNAACSKSDPAMIYLPKGRYLLKPIQFNGGNCKSNDITIYILGSLQAPEDSDVLGNSTNWLSFYVVNGVKFVGAALDAKGKYIWDCKNKGGKNCPHGAASLAFTRSKNIEIRDVVSLNSQFFHMVINGCKNVKVEDVNIIAAGNSPNTDGIHVQYSDNVTVYRASIKTGDDCISVGPGTKDLSISLISCKDGHGISIGSLARDAEEPGVQNVAVKNVVFTDTTNGLRIKSWARPSTGFVNGVRYENVIMHDVQNPILIDQHYCPYNLDCPGQESGVKVSNVVYRDIKGTSATEIAVKFDCSSTNPCTGIMLDHVNLMYQNQAAKAYCENADGASIGVVQPTSCF